ncbi:hydroxyisourate hydrolase [filamentous cyanobacterium CCP5]|nr:hydroxyisourate hydrolase [filamentous cyanobacterium CCP5]
MGGLTTHVLDTALGKPAAAIQLTLWLIDSHSQADIKTALKTVTTNDDGRTDEPLLSPEEMAVGTYELVFEVGGYFRSYSPNLTEPAFLDQIPIRFAISDTHSHYHVPLLVSPWAYSTYRGS